jgi:hypothetical protein
MFGVRIIRIFASKYRICYPLLINQENILFNHPEGPIAGIQFGGIGRLKEKKALLSTILGERGNSRAFDKGKTLIKEKSI